MTMEKLADFTELWPTFETKMQDAGIKPAALTAFKRNLETFLSGETGMIAEDSIDPVESLPYLSELRSNIEVKPELMKQAVVMKLNGGLGTGMGLDKAKSLIEVRDGLTFLDLIIKQIIHMRESTSGNVRLLFLNSFNTSEDTLSFVEKGYPDFTGGAHLEVMQSQVPKIDASSMNPVEWADSPHNEWCPPGHGDLYPSLFDSGAVQVLLDHGFKYLFVSNSDNLGATLDPVLLSYFAESDKPFLMEVAARTASDKKGGHLACRKTDGQLLLRESAQCPDEDTDSFQNVDRHRFFNTNNIWIRLDKLQELLDQNEGSLPLPIIRNNKTVDPKDKSSTKVIQLESAMGAAIECFSGAGAILVERDRFSPVKTTADLMVLRSDCYDLTEDFRLVLKAERNGKPPVVKLDSDHYKLMGDFQKHFPAGVPSLIKCDTLTVKGSVQFKGDESFEGDVTLGS